MSTTSPRRRPPPRSDAPSPLTWLAVASRSRAREASFRLTASMWARRSCSPRSPTLPSRDRCWTSVADGDRSPSRSGCSPLRPTSTPSTSTSGPCNSPATTQHRWGSIGFRYAALTKFLPTSGSHRSGPTRRSAWARRSCTTCCAPGCRGWNPAERHTSSSPRTSEATPCSGGSPPTSVCRASATGPRAASGCSRSRADRPAPRLVGPGAVGDKHRGTGKFLSLIHI